MFRVTFYIVVCTLCFSMLFHISKKVIFSFQNIYLVLLVNYTNISMNYEGCIVEKQNKPCIYVITPLCLG